MKVFVTSDNHFYHKNIIWFSNRPFKDVEEMNQTMIDKWNKKVTNDDLVIHLGDFAFASSAKIKEVRKKLNGTIFLIKGNHDKAFKMRRLGFIVVNGELQMGNLLLSHKPVYADGLINVHGHIHQRKSYHGINACVDVTNFEPVPIENYFNQAQKMLRYKFDKMH